MPAARRNIGFGTVLVLALAGCGNTDGHVSQPPQTGSRPVAGAASNPIPQPSATASRAPRKVMTKPVAGQPTAKATPAADKPSSKQASAPAPVIPPPLPPLPQLGLGSNFQLTDQFGKPHACQFPKDRPSVLAFGDKDGSSQIEGWIKPLYEAYTDRIDIQGIAELGMVPGFARGMVQGIMSALTKNPVMLDWDGSVSKAYGYAGGGQAAILVIDPDGVIRWRSTGAATATGLSDAQRALDRLLTDAATQGLPDHN